jgi:hypothetical protein
VKKCTSWTPDDDDVSDLMFFVFIRGSVKPFPAGFCYRQVPIGTSRHYYRHFPTLLLEQPILSLVCLPTPKLLTY